MRYTGKNVRERMEYLLLFQSVSLWVFTFTNCQTTHLCNFLSLQSRQITRSSSVVKISILPTCQNSLYDQGTNYDIFSMQQPICVINIRL